MNDTVTVDGQPFAIRFPDAGTFVQLSISGLALNIGGFVTLEGDITFTHIGDRDVFAATNVTLFVEQVRST